MKTSTTPGNFEARQEDMELLPTTAAKAGDPETPAQEGGADNGCLCFACGK